MAIDPSDDVAAAARDSWIRFRRSLEPLRPELYRYCRHLTRSPWEAEDLVQDTLARALVTLASLYSQQIENPRAWLFRVASNLWIDRLRRAREDLRDVDREAVADAPDPRAVREAAGTLLARLSPQERVAVVLKDAFDLTLDEIAATLGTTVGAVKAALHRGRSKLAAPEPDLPRVPRPPALDAFCAAFNAGDLASLTALCLDTVTVELTGSAIDYGVDATRDPGTGILYHTLRSPLSVGVAARYLGGYRPTPPRAEARVHRGEHLVLLWYAHDDGDAVRLLVRLEPAAESVDRIARVREYPFSPELLAEVCGELGVPFRPNGYDTDEI